MMTLVGWAQNITGVVTDAKTGLPIPFANVRYEKGGGGQTDTDGNFSLPFKAGRIYVSIIGYDTKNFKVSQPGHHQVKLDPTDLSFDEVVVTGRKDKYSRKNNPAVELMRKVIAANKNNNLKEHDYYSIDRYSKLTLAFNEMTERVFQEGEFKKFAFLKEHVETCNETGKLILPLSVDEAVTRYIYRKDPETEKSIVLGKRSTGVNDLINTGEIMSTMLQDCFSDVDIYQDDIRLLQYPFTSPISSKTAIGFYRYFIEDTLQVDNEKCIHVSFTPNNSQDFGFSGNLYIVADSTYRVKRVQMGVPMRTGINFVEGMDITQVYEQLPSGEQVLIKDDMIVQLRLAKFIQKFQVRRTTEYSNYDFSKIPDKAFRFKGDQMTAANAMMQDEEFWEERRSEDLTASEDKMSLFIKRLEGIKGFKPVLFVGKAFIENFVETSVDPKHPSKVDIGPVNTMISQNFVDGLRLRASAQTTANLHPHIFLRGYVAYGFKDHRWKGLGEVTYSFNEKAYLPREFPVNNLTFTYNRDVMSPSDKFMPTDKDNVFISFKWTDVEHMMYYENYTLRWDREWENGVRFKLQLRTEENEPTAALFYQPLIAGSGPTKQGYLGKIRTTDLTAALTYQPGAKWMNTKQRRIAANNDAPIYSLSHTTGVEGVLGSDYTYNVTEAGVYKRFWMNSWGKIDVNLKGGVQWNKVPYPLLIMPAANLSYIIEDNTFNLIDNMEFLNDRYASLMLSWDMNGKLFNRIPLLKKLKWREFIGCNVLWGTLSSKNNPFLEKN
ncbi:MAG: carboxypeptidase-like regulatory domain-containing protein, partial [Bacteroidaceae bacterium]|nr:carboxypeptidase-like regulatory domain-containing protein [Bacteroidaceae bacterium]